MFRFVGETSTSHGTNSSLNGKKNAEINLSSASMSMLLLTHSSTRKSSPSSLVGAIVTLADGTIVGVCVASGRGNEEGAAVIGMSTGASVGSNEIGAGPGID